MYPISVNANCWPIQVLGPPLNGMYCHGFGDHESQRSGLNSDTSGPKMSTRRCITKVEYATRVPAVTPMGWSRILSVVMEWRLAGVVLYIAAVWSASRGKGCIRECDSLVERGYNDQYLSINNVLPGYLPAGYILNVSLMTCWRYFIPFKSEYVGAVVGPMVLRISTLRRFTHSGRFASSYSVQAIVPAVVSCSVCISHRHNSCHIQAESELGHTLAANSAATS